MENKNKTQQANNTTSRSWQKIQPREVTLWQRENGLYCRLASEESDDYGKKYFFPDRSCSSLVEGPAIITEIKDMGTYGFFKAAMKQFVAPSEQQLADYILEHHLEYCFIRFMEGPFGSYVSLVSGRDSSCTQLALEGDNVKKMLRDGVDDCFSTVKEQISAMNFLCQGYQGCTADELLEKFEPTVYRHRIPADAIRSPKEASAAFYDAVQIGFLEVYRIKGHDVVTVNSENVLNAILRFSQTEMDDLIQNVNQTNTAAKEAFQNQMKKGKSSLTLFF